ncbi:MAG: ribokinase [Oscillospiraceae bacterium]
MAKKPRILVVGSLVMDLIVSTPRVPHSGETVIGTSYRTAPGGKGANQAVQAARLGAQVTMVGKVGSDAFGRELTETVKAAGIDVSHIGIDEKACSAIGNILLEVTPEGTQNRITVVPGANFAITREDVAFLKNEIQNYDMLILQLEIPMEIIEEVAQYAYDAGVPVMLNSAPSAPLSEKLLHCLTYISPNEHEAADLTGIPIGTDQHGVCQADLRRCTDALLQKGVQNVIITLGENGAVIANAAELILVPRVTVDHVADPTAAGDSFVGAFCTAVCAGLTHRQALEFSAYVAALTVSRMGAMPSLPTLAEVEGFMAQRNAPHPTAPEALH